MSKTFHRALGASTLAVTALLAGACGGGSSGGGTAEAESEQVDIGPADVTIVNFAYEDAEFTASVGDEVVWVNEGAAPHTVTSDAFDSGIIRSGAGWMHTFEEAGTYDYWCSNHESMKGTIVVE